MIDATIALTDRGMFESLAARLTREYSRVLYFREWKSTAPTPRERHIGTGYEFEAIQNLDDFRDEIDIYCFPFLYDEPVQERLRSDGKAVWGAGDGAFLELDREFLLETMERVGLAVPEWTTIKGTSALKVYLDKHPGVYVKISYDRGLCETFYSIDGKRSAAKLLSLENDLYPFHEEQQFIVVQKVQGKNLVETGYDGYNILGQFPRVALYGVEKKDAAYFQTSIPYDNLPKQVRDVNTKLAPILKQLGYSGFMFTEVLGDILLDITCRHATPAGECVQELCSNLGQIIYDGAHGKLTEPKIAYRYAAQVMFTSEQAAKFPLEIKVPDKIRQYVKLYDSSFKDGSDIIIPTHPHDAIIGSVVGVGNTPNEAEKHCLSMAEQLKGNGIEWDETALSEAKKDLLKLS